MAGTNHSQYETSRLHLNDAYTPDSGASAAHSIDIDRETSPFLSSTRDRRDSFSSIRMKEKSSMKNSAPVWQNGIITFLNPSAWRKKGSVLPTSVGDVAVRSGSRNGSKSGESANGKGKQKESVEIAMGSLSSQGASGSRNGGNGNGNGVHVASLPPLSPYPSKDGEEPPPNAIGIQRPGRMRRCGIVTVGILTHSYVNVLLIFVPIGIAVHFNGCSAITVFIINAIAIIPLAGLLSHATENVAKRMGDALGALMNVSFGNAVELIIFIIALKKDEIRIVQASLVGSIIANMLAILGMSFLFGGLRYREQVYNSTVTQMSGSLLSLSVMSLLLPTAFHAAFRIGKVKEADSAVLSVSRGTSVILLIVYGLYLVFQLHTHAYLYVGTPQHVIDEEAQPGPMRRVWNDAYSDDETSDSSSSSSSDSDAGNGSAAKRIKRAFSRSGRKSRTSSREVNGNGNGIGPYGRAYNAAIDGSLNLPVDPAEQSPFETPSRHSSYNSRGSSGHGTRARKSWKKKYKQKKKAQRAEKREAKRTAKEAAAQAASIESSDAETVAKQNELRQRDGANLFKPGSRATAIDFALPTRASHDGLRDEPEDSQKAKRAARPSFSRGVSQSRSVFSTKSEQPASASAPRIYGVHRTNSLPQQQQGQGGSLDLPRPLITPGRQRSTTITQEQSLPPFSASVSFARSDLTHSSSAEDMSRTTAVLLLLISTGLVAICAHGLVSSIEEVTRVKEDGTSGMMGETFVGLIVLPVVGNAAEHITAVSVACKNKMDLSLGVAVGSSIQIALFITPTIILLAWFMGKSMSLYFTLFETSALFASTFIINFLILDGRSNYLEGALLCAGYAIVSLSAWYYPEGELQEVVSELAGQAPAMVGNVSSLVSGLPAGVMMVKEVVREGVTLWEKVG